MAGRTPSCPHAWPQGPGARTSLQSVSCPVASRWGSWARWPRCKDRALAYSPQQAPCPGSGPTLQPLAAALLSCHWAPLRLPLCDPRGPFPLLPCVSVPATPLASLPPGTFILKCPDSPLTGFHPRWPGLGAVSPRSQAGDALQALPAAPFPFSCALGGQVQMCSDSATVMWSKI